MSKYLAVRDSFVSKQIQKFISAVVGISGGNFRDPLTHYFEVPKENIKELVTKEEISQEQFDAIGEVDCIKETNYFETGIKEDPNGRVKEGERTSS